jgi:hypothetical protein
VAVLKLPIVLLKRASKPSAVFHTPNANIVMPSEAEREERRAVHARLDAIARRLMEPEPEQPHGARIAP